MGTRQELEQFKTSFAESDEGPYGTFENQLGALLERAEDLLLALCGRERYSAMMDAANRLAELHYTIRQARKDYDSDTKRRATKQLEEETESLKRRIAGIEFRG